MKDFVSTGTGNSRYLKSVSDFLTQYPTYADMAAALIAGTFPIDLNGINNAGVLQIGTPLNTGNLLSAATATKMGLDPDTATPNDAFNHVLPLIFENVSVPTSAWAADATYAEYGYRATVPLTGVTSDMVPSVILAPADSEAGVYAPVSATYAGGVYIYANSVPGAALTIPTIICIGGAV